MNLGPIAVVVMICSLGATTVFLRLAIDYGSVDDARILRSSFQTLAIVIGVLAVKGISGFHVKLSPGVAFAALNGALGGVAFILFSKGLESVDVSRAKPAMVVGMVVPVVLGVALLQEPMTVRKAAGVILAGVAVYLLSTDGQ
ncbi:MAG: drug/metabolite transporter (DMT)-like permease [Halobacteriales archaeon]|jgi:drug/metabolite transporter (DMT)-like permease